MHTTPALPPSVGRPPSLLVAAVICFIFGAFGLLGLFGAVMSLADIQFGAMPGTEDATKAMMHEPHIRAVTIYGGLLSTLGGIAAIAAGVGLLKCREWARKVVIGWCLYRIAAAGVNFYVTFFYMTPHMQRLMQAQVEAQSAGKSALSSQSAAQMGSIISSASAIITLFFSIAISITLLVLVTRIRARAACRQPT